MVSNHTNKRTHAELLASALIIIVPAFLLWAHPYSIQSLPYLQKIQTFNRLSKTQDLLEDTHQAMKFPIPHEPETCLNFYIQKQKAQNSKKTFTPDISQEDGCLAKGNKRFPSKIIITILHHKDKQTEQQMKKQLQEIQQFVNSLMPNQGNNQSKASQFLTLLVQTIEPAAFPSHIQDKIKSAETENQYMREIGEALETMRPLTHCRYTHQHCQNYVVYLSRKHEIEDVHQVGNVLFIQEDQYERALLKILEMEVFIGSEDPMADWLRYIKIINILHLKKEIEHLRYLCQNSPKYQISPQVIQAYLSSVDLYLTSATQNQLPPNAINWLQINRMDLFPTEYKLGVYLPLILLFLIFPLGALLNSR